MADLHRLTLRTMGGRNTQGLPVMRASCLCSWSHMTAYRFHAGLTGWLSARRYLRARYQDHLTAGTSDYPLSAPNGENAGYRNPAGGHDE